MPNKEKRQNRRKNDGRGEKLKKESNTIFVKKAKRAVVIVVRKRCHCTGEKKKEKKGGTSVCRRLMARIEMAK